METMFSNGLIPPNLDVNTRIKSYGKSYFFNTKVSLFKYVQHKDEE